jgi:hypothetical protein
VLAAKYGDHAYDQWSVDELLDIARSVRDLLAPADRPRPGSDAAGGGSQDPVPA